MLTIKITLWDLFQGIQDWVNNTLNTDLNLFDVNYSEFYIYPKKVDLYVKQEKGKFTKESKKAKRDPNIDPNTGKPYKSERDKAVLSYDFDSPHHPKNDPKPE